MSNITDVVGMTADLLRGAGGLQSNLDSVSASEEAPRAIISERQILTQNLPVDIVEKSGGRHYPMVHVYCEKVINNMQEKFRSFSGRMDMAIEIRASSDRLELLDLEINLMVDAVLGTLDQNRGDWGLGVFFGGSYEVAYAPVKQGGKNYLQTAKVMFSLEVSRG